MMMVLLAEATGQDSTQVVLWDAIIGAVGAILASALGGAFSSWFARQQERRALAAALAAEMQGVMDVVARRQLLTGCYRTMRFSRKALSSLISRYSSSLVHFLVRIEQSL
jgi:uncharacterized membrane protein YeaQ/YmgE (transglycosylase-associated protein family)